jgi:hypothetical protein
MNQLTDVGSRPITVKRCLQRLWMQSRRKRARWQRMQNEAHGPALTPDLWLAFEDLFGENGAVGGCTIGLGG